MEDKAIAYFRTPIGDYALVPKMRGDYGITPKNMLVCLSMLETDKHRHELIKLETRCAETHTGARFCMFENKEPYIYIEAMEMTLPSYRYSIMLKERREPTLEEARRTCKNAFLVLACKPESLCGEKEHLT